MNARADCAGASRSRRRRDGFDRDAPARRCLLLAFFTCLLQVGLPRGADAQDGRVFIDDHWPIRGPNGSTLSPPRVKPTNECSTSVYVDAFVPKAQITVFVNGAQATAPTATVFGFADIPLKPLHTGDTVTAIQTVNGINSSPSAPMIAGKMPATLAAPTVDPKIYACGRVVAVRDLTAGVSVEVRDVTAASPIGSGATPNLWGSDWAPVATAPLVGGHLITARQSACTGVVSADALVAPPVQPDPDPLAPPKLDTPIVGNDAVTAHGLLTGSLLRIFQGAEIGSGLSTGETNWIQVAARIAAAPPAAGVASEQDLCKPGPRSTPVTPTDRIPPPLLLGPICPRQSGVVVRDTTINATLVLLKNGAVAGYGGAAPGDVPLAIAPPAVLADGDAVQVVEYIGTNSVRSATLTVNCFKQNVVTQHNDNARSGAQLAETTLTPANVSGPRFGLLYDRAVLGTILAQPLYVHGVKSRSALGGTVFRNLVYVATSQDIVYAFDADDTSNDVVVGGESTKAIWRRALGTPHTGDICGETDPPVVGITGTPAIDVSAGRMYVVARDQRGQDGMGFETLHALDIATGADLANVNVGAVASIDGATVRFNPACQRQRPGLLLQGGNVYLGYGTYNCDGYCPAGEPYRGWVIGYRASDFAPAGTFVNSQKADEGGMGIWASGNGLAGNEDGSAIFYQTGNDIGGSGLAANGDAFVKLTSSGASLSFAGRFQPANAGDLRDGDTDLGSGGPMLLPGGRLVGGGKDGAFHLLSQSDLKSGATGFQAFFNTFHFGPGPYPYNAPPVYAVKCPLDSPVGHVANQDQHCWIDTALYPKGESYGPNIHGGPIYWATGDTKGLVYKMAEKDYLKAFAYDAAAGTLDPVPARVATIRPARDGMPGGFSSLSASGRTNGIVWTVVQQLDGQWGPASNAILYAFDATTLRVLWNNAGVDEAAFAKFNSPTIADGRVFLPSVGHFQVYGLARVPPRRWRDPLRGLALARAIEQRWLFSGGAAGTLGPPAGQQADAARGSVDERTHADFAQDVVGGGYGNISLPAGVQIVIPMCMDPATQNKTRIVSSIYASQRTGAHIVRGEIRRVFLATGGLQRFGYPVTDEVPTADGFGLMTKFERGTLVWYPGKEVRVDVDHR